MNQKKFTIEHEGKAITFETGKLAPQTNASVLVQVGETVILATATMSKQAREAIDFFPLMVDYEEKEKIATPNEIDVLDRCCIELRDLE